MRINGLSEPDLVNSFPITACAFQMGVIQLYCYRQESTTITSESDITNNIISVEVNFFCISIKYDILVVNNK